MAELRDTETVGDRTTNVVEGIAVSPDEEVLLPPIKDAASSYTWIPNATASRSVRPEPHENATDEADSNSNGGDEADIAFATLSRLAGGAALGAVVGTWILPGVGSLAGVALGGALGAYAPSILLRAKPDGRRDGGGNALSP